MSHLKLTQVNRDVLKHPLISALLRWDSRGRAIRGHISLHGRNDLSRLLYKSSLGLAPHLKVA